MICYYIVYGVFGIGEVVFVFVGGQQFLQFLLVLCLVKSWYEGVDYGVYIFQCFGSGCFLFWFLDWQSGDLYGFDFQCVVFQCGGGIEIFVNFVGGVGQVSLIVIGGDGMEFVQRQFWVIGVEFFVELID